MTDIRLSTDWHLWSKINNDRHPRHSVNEIRMLRDNMAQYMANQPDCCWLYLGDLCDPEVSDIDTIKDILSHIECGEKILIRGNRDTEPDEWYLDLGFTRVADAVRIHNMIFTHKPIRVAPDEVNIHGHFHGSKHSIVGHQHIDCYDGSYDLSEHIPVAIEDVLAKSSDDEEEGTESELFDSYRETLEGDKLKVIDLTDEFDLYPIDEAFNSFQVIGEAYINQDKDEDRASIMNEASNQSDTAILRQILQLNEELNKMEYGLLLPGYNKIPSWDDRHNKLTYDEGDKAWFEHWRLATPDQFIKQNGGVCWDFAAYEAYYFKEHFPSIPFKCWYVEFDDDNTMPNHTFLTFRLGKNFYWFESSFKAVQGVYKARSELDLISRVVFEMDQYKDGQLHKYPLRIWTYDATDDRMYGLDIPRFMDWIHANGTECHYTLRKDGGKVTMITADMINESYSLLEAAKYKDGVYSCVNEAVDSLPPDGWEDLLRFNHQLDEYDYGCIDNGVRYVWPNVNQDDFDAHYHTYSSEEFHTNKIGICWDHTRSYAEWFRTNRPDIKYSTWFMAWCGDGSQEVLSTHTILIFNMGNGKFGYPESTFTPYEGIWVGNSVDEIIDTVLLRMKKFLTDPKNKKYVLSEPKIYLIAPYDALNPDLIGLSANDFLRAMNRAIMSYPKAKRGINYASDLTTKIEYEYDGIISETTFKSKLDPNFKPKVKISISSLKRVTLTKEYLNKHKGDPGWRLLKHVRHNEEMTQSIGWEDDSGKLVAIVTVSTPKDNDEKYGGRKWVSDLEVHKDYQGHGIGSQILDYAIDTMGANAIGVDYDNEVAKSLYLSRGFKYDKDSVDAVKSGKRKTYLMYLSEEVQLTELDEALIDGLEFADELGDDDETYLDKLDKAEQDKSTPPVSMVEGVSKEAYERALQHAKDNKTRTMLKYQYAMNDVIDNSPTSVTTIDEIRRAFKRVTPFNSPARRKAWEKGLAAAVDFATATSFLQFVKREINYLKNEIFQKTIFIWPDFQKDFSKDKAQAYSNWLSNTMLPKANSNLEKYRSKKNLQEATNIEPSIKYDPQHHTEFTEKLTDFYERPMTSALIRKFAYRSDFIDGCPPHNPSKENFVYGWFDDTDDLVAMVRVCQYNQEGDSWRGISRLYISPEHRGHGLSHQVLNRALELGGTRLWVRSDNPVAEQLYVKHGFVRRKVDSKVDSSGEYVSMGLNEATSSKPGAILLTSTGFDNPNLKKLFTDHIGAPSKTKVLFIPTAANDEESRDVLQLCVGEIVDCGIPATNIVWYNLDGSIPKKELTEFDAIYVAGGSETVLARAMAQDHFSDVIKALLAKGGIYVGVSAGSMVLTDMGLIPNAIEPHQNRKHSPNGPLPSANERINISDNQAVWICGDTSAILESAFNKPNLELNVQKWIDGDTKILFITGLSGGGKSTLAQEMAAKYNAEVISLDYVSNTLRKGTDWLYQRRNQTKLTAHRDMAHPFDFEFVESHPDIGWGTYGFGIRPNDDPPKDPMVIYINWLINKCEKTGKRYIIEGVQITNMPPEAFTSHALIIIGTGELSASWRRLYRELSADRGSVGEKLTKIDGLRKAIPHRHQQAEWMDDFRNKMEPYTESITDGLEYDGLLNESTAISPYWYHLVPKGTDISEGIISPWYAYKTGRKTLAKSMTDKYRYRLCNGWNIYPGRNPESLTTEEVLDGLDMHRGEYGSKRIYLFKYAPTSDLGPNMANVLANKDVYRVDISKIKDLISIDYGYYMSNTDNRALTQRDYMVSQSDYFANYDDNNNNMLFSTINHISVLTKSGKISPSAIEMVVDAPLVETSIPIPRASTDGIVNTVPGREGVWEPCIKINGIPHREVCQVLIIKPDGHGNWLIFGNPKSSVKYFEPPGGGTNPNEPLEVTALRESEEEARLKIKNPQYHGAFTMSVEELGWKPDPNYPGGYMYPGGKYIHVFTAEYAGLYRGKIAEVDKDEDMMENGKWIQVNEIYPMLHPKFQDALADRLGYNGPIHESIHPNTIQRKLSELLVEMTIDEESGNHKSALYADRNATNTEDKYGLRHVGATHDAEDEIRAAEEEAERKRELKEKRKALKEKERKRKDAIKRRVSTRKRNRFIKKMKTILPGQQKNEMSAAGVGSNPGGYHPELVKVIDLDIADDDIMDKFTYPDAMLRENFTFNFEVPNSRVIFNEGLTKSKNDKLYPVYVCLIHSGTGFSNIIKAATNAPFSHASISFDPDLKKLYSFTLLGSSSGYGMTVESREDYKNLPNRVPYGLYMVPVTESGLNQMKLRIQYFLDHASDFRYNSIGCLEARFGISDNNPKRFFCSQFVAEILKYGNPNEKSLNDPSLMKPMDLANLPVAKFITSGFIDEYNTTKVKRITNQLLRSMKLSKKLHESVIDYPVDSPWGIDIIDHQLRCVDETIIDNFFRYMSSFKLRFDEKGNVIITRREYDNLAGHFRHSLRIIKAAKNSGDIESIKEELYKINYMVQLIDQYYLSVDSKNLRPTQVDTRKDFMDLRSVMLNTLKTEVEYVMRVDPSWNFQKGFDSSKYGKELKVPKKLITDIGQIIVAM